MKIEVSTEVGKALELAARVSRRTVDSILRDLMELPAANTERVSAKPAEASGLVFSDGTVLPGGLKLRGKHQGKYFFGEVGNGKIMVEGKAYDTPSRAAKDIKGYAENGWRWFEGQDENGGWHALDYWRKRDR